MTAARILSTAALLIGVAGVAQATPRCDEDDTTTVEQSPPAVESGDRPRIGGPMFVVSLSRPGAPSARHRDPVGLLEGLPADAERVGRAISRSVRWGAGGR